MLVSNYHFYKMNSALGNFHESFDKFFELFRQGRLVYGDYFDNVTSWWEHRDNPAVLIVHYEDMKRDLRAQVGVGRCWVVLESVGWYWKGLVYVGRCWLVWARAVRCWRVVQVSVYVSKC